MREALAVRDCSGHEGQARRNEPERERGGETRAHLAYYLCYPYMVDRKRGDERPGPWEQRL